MTDPLLRTVNDFDAQDAARFVSAQPYLYKTELLRSAAKVLCAGDEADQHRALRIATELELRGRGWMFDPRPAGNGRIRRALAICAAVALAAIIAIIAPQAGAKAAADVARYHAGGGQW